MSAFDAELSYFRFDGKRYRRIGRASRLTEIDKSERVTISPYRQ